MRYKQRGRYKYIGKYGLSGLRMPRRPPKYKTRQIVADERSRDSKGRFKKGKTNGD